MNNNIRDELKEIAPSLAGIGNENGYRVPDNYFEYLAEEVMSKIQLPFTDMPLTAPAPTYFEGLADTILNKIKSSGTIVEAENETMQELTELSPLLAGMKKVNVYTVPKHYFDNFNVAIPTAGKQTKVRAMYQPAKWMRYVAAAVVVGIISTGGFFLFKDGNETGKTDFTFTRAYEPLLSSVSDNAITNYLKQSPAQMDITAPTFEDGKIDAGSLVEQLLDNVSDSDIQEYLQENQQTGEKDIKGI